MPEILTESFCERCGTRYTFESGAPKARRLGRFRTISRGLKTFVMSDDTSLDEALAAARSDEEREATAHQLDAFHKTFNFCMSCRQYTCANCWNEVDGVCLTCAPHLGHEILPAPFPNLDPGVDLASGLTTEPTTNGRAAPAFENPAWPTVDAQGDGPAEPGLVPTAAEATSALAPDVVESVARDDGDQAPGPVDATPDQPAAAELAEPTAGSHAIEPAVPPAQPAARAARTVDDRAAAAAAQTAALLARFRPGQSIDEVLEEYEAAVANVGAAPVPARPEPVAPAGEPVAPAGEPVAPAGEPVAPRAAAPEPEPVPTAEDRIEQPAWRLVAPDSSPRAADGHPAEVPSRLPAPASDVPQWPSTPQWPQPASAVDSLAFLTSRRGGPEDVWTSSSRDLIAAAPAAGPAVAGVQSCVSCGLSLSATARFCRRCGTRQAG